MKAGWIVLIVVVALVAILALSLAGGYNGLVAQQESVKTAFSAIDTQLQRRADLIPNLVATVKGFAAQEKTVIASIADARAKLAGATTVGDKATADAELTGALSRLLVVVENYPELKTDKTFIALMDELAGTENRIAVARKDYNDVVKTYNTKVRTFPTVLYAGLFGFAQAEYFEAAPGSSTAPTVSFS